MRLSHKSDYALRALLMLSRCHGEGRPVPVREISEREHIPEKFLVQILLALKKAGVLRSRMGIRGGYRLARDPESITFADVIRILDGPTAPVRCIEGPGYEPCPEEAGCGVRGVMLEIHGAVERILNGKTLADICHGQKSLAS